MKKLFNFFKHPLDVTLNPNKSKEIMLAAVGENPSSLEFIDHDQQTEELCLLAVRQNGMTLRHVKTQTDEICLAAVKQNGFALKYVINQTHEICLAAVKQNGVVIQYIK